MAVTDLYITDDGRISGVPPPEFLRRLRLNKVKKDPINCPFCEAEEKGFSDGWGFSPEGWEELEKKHLEEHCEKPIGLIWVTLDTI